MRFSAQALNLALLGGLIVTSACITTPRTRVFYNGRIKTMDTALPEASALAVVGNRIAALGNDEEIRKQFPAPAEQIDLGQKRVIPGLTESHAHFLGVGFAKLNLNLVGIKSEGAVAEMVQEKAALRPRGEWIKGRGWDQNDWPTPSFPTYRSLERAAPGHPVALNRIDGHALWCNALAMKLAGIDRTTQDPAGGKIIRDTQGNPTGVFIDNAMPLITAHIPKPSRAQNERAAEIAAKEALRLGITSLHDAGAGDELIELAQDFIAKGRPLPRLYIMLDGSDQALLSRHFAKGPTLGERLTVRSIKFYADGALGSRGAAMLAPYSDDPHNRGLMLMSKDQLADLSLRGIQHGFQIATHAIGDEANRSVLDAYEAALGSLGKDKSNLRLRIEHAQIVHPSDVARFRTLGVVASVQPTHCTSDMPWAPLRLGAERIARDAYPWRSFLQAGVPLAAGSDAPIEALDPMLGLYAATTRRSTEGEPKEGWQPKQKLSLDEALHAFTLGGAYAEFQEHQKGKLASGYLADFVVLSRDIFSEGPASIVETQVDVTLLDGEVVYNRSLGRIYNETN